MVGDGIPKVWSRYDQVLPFYDARNWLEKFSADVSPHTCMPYFRGGYPPHRSLPLRVSIFVYASDMRWSYDRRVQSYLRNGLVIFQISVGQVSDMFESCVRHVLVMCQTYLGNVSGMFR